VKIVKPRLYKVRISCKRT